MATAGAAAEAPVKGGGMKKLIIIIAAVALLVVVGGAAALMMLNKSAKAEDDGEGGEGTHSPAPKKHEAKKGEPPVFVPLEPFTVNLSDKEVDRFAQVGVTLQVADAHAGDEIKAFLPAIRSNVLVLLSHKTSVELLSPDGKDKLARDILREAVRPLGYDLEDEDEAPAAGAKKKKKRRISEADLPITQVLFSSFIVQ